jgi:hypothetical protein
MKTATAPVLTIEELRVLAMSPYDNPLELTARHRKLKVIAEDLVTRGYLEKHTTGLTFRLTDKGSTALREAGVYAAALIAALGLD